MQGLGRRGGFKSTWEFGNGISDNVKSTDSDNTFKRELKESSTCYKSTPLKLSEANFNSKGHAATDEVSRSLKWHNQPGKDF